MLVYILLLVFSALSGIFVYSYRHEDTQSLRTRIRPTLMPILLLYGIAFIGLTPTLMIAGALFFFLADVLRIMRSVPSLLSFGAMFAGQLFYCGAFAADLYPSDSIMWQATLTLIISAAIAIILYFSLRNKIASFSVSGTFFLAGSVLLSMLALLRLMSMLRFIEAWIALLGTLLMLVYNIMFSAPESRATIPNRDIIASAIYLCAQFCIITGLCYV